MSKVAVMCGHGTQTNGKWDCGTTYAGYNEAALMLPITKSAVKYLRASGVTVISDADKNNNKNMIADVAWANKEKVALYVSIHCDYSKAPSGVMPLYVSAQGKKLATALNTAIKNGIPMKSRGVVKRTDLYELNSTDMPACILETGSIKADLKILKGDPDKYGKFIAIGICNYLGMSHKEPTPTPQPQTHLYRVRKAWKDTKSQVGAFKSLENAKAECDKHKGYHVYDENGKAVYPVKTLTDKIMDACKTQSDWMKNAKYGDYSPVTLEHSKKDGTCVTYEGCVLQRLGYLKSGQYVWQNGKGYGTGKVTGTNDKMTVTYMNNKTLKSLKSKLKAGDMILLDDNKSGKSGSGGHVFFLTGKWTDKGNPYIWDFDPNKTCAKKGKPRAYNGERKVLAVVRLK